MNRAAEAVEEAQGYSAAYECAVCGESMERDLVAFLRHTEHHILDALREQHPGTLEEEGRNSRLLDIYHAQLGHDPWLSRENY